MGKINQGKEQPKVQEKSKVNNNKDKNSNINHQNKKKKEQKHPSNKKKDGKREKEDILEPTKKKGVKDINNEADHANSCNDIDYYNEDPQLLKDAGSFSYASVAGLDLDLLDPSVQHDVTNTSVPGLMIIKLAPTIGISRDMTSPVNVTANTVYAAMRSKITSVYKTFRASDLMMYYLSAASLYNYYAELVRLYCLLFTYSKMNRYVGRFMVESLGYEYDDLVENLAALRYYINIFATQVNQFAVPDWFKYFDRQSMLPLNIYKDSKEVKAQMYAFQYEYYFKFTEDIPGKYFGISGLEPVQIKASGANGGTTLEDIIYFGNTLLDAMRLNDDIGIMSGNTITAFGTESLRTLGSIAENATIEPKYDEMMLAQIHNLTIVGQFAQPTDEVRQNDAGAMPDSLSGYVVQDPDNYAIIYDPLFYNSQKLDSDTKLINYVLDSGMDNPTPEFNMEATRLKSSVRSYYTAEEGGFDLQSCGTEIVTTVKIMSLQTQASKANPLSVSTISSFGTIDNNSIVPAIQYKFNIAKGYFDWAPITYEVDTSDDYTVVYPVGELFNYTPISINALTKLDTVALMSLFSVNTLFNKIKNR